MMVQYPATTPELRTAKVSDFQAFLYPHLQAFLHLQRATEQRLHACGVAAADARGGLAKRKHSCAHTEGDPGWKQSPSV